MIFENPAFNDHERVIACCDAPSGLHAIIAIHDRTLGPAAGGCRVWRYPDSGAALTDVLRLSEAMSYKNALAGLPLGGGKAVIIADRSAEKGLLLQAFGRCVEALAGDYWTAEDIGVNLEDVETIAESTRYVFGLKNRGLRTGDPSPFTALGCFHGMRAAILQRLGRSDFGGIRVAVQGVGNVGYELCKLLHHAGASLVISDPSAAAIERVCAEIQAQVVRPEAILDQDVEIFAPCALGGVLNEASIQRLRATVVAGVANNQLADSRHGLALARRGILYTPDYVLNAGGMLNASGDILGYYDPAEVQVKIAAIYDLCLEIFHRADAQKCSPADVADAMARDRIQAARKAR